MDKKSIKDQTLSFLCLNINLLKCIRQYMKNNEVMNLRKKIKNKRLFFILHSTNYTNPNLTCIQT